MGLRNRAKTLTLLMLVPGMKLALSTVRMARKEVRRMKIATSILAGVLFIGTMGVVNTVVAADGVISESVEAVQ